MGSYDRVTHAGKLASVPYSTCGLDVYSEVAKVPTQCHNSEPLPEDYQRIVNVGHQLIVVLCTSLLVITTIIVSVILCRLVRSQASNEAREPHASSRASPHKTAVASVPGPVENRIRPSDPPASDNSDACTFGRGKSRIVREIIPESPSNKVRVRAQSASAYAEIDTPLTTYEPQSDERSETARNKITHPEGSTQNTPGVRRGSSNPLHQASPPVTDVDGAWFGFFQAGFYRPFTFLAVVGQFTTTVIRYWPIPRLGNPSLLHSLYGPGCTFSIFAIAGGDAERDLQALHCALMDSCLASARFVSLNPEVGLNNFRAEIKKLYDEYKKVPSTHLFIYLTGHGNKKNRMIISEYKSINENDLFELLSGPTIPVTVLFDICRPDGEPCAIPPKGISLIWTCSLGKNAGAGRMPNCNSPDSYFLTALMISACTPDLQHTSDTLQKNVQMRLDQLVNFWKEVYSMEHLTGRCSACSTKHEPCYKPVQQNIDWGGAENMDGLLELTKILSGSKFAEDVYQRFTGDDIFVRVNNLPDLRRLRLTDLEDGGGKLGLSPAVTATPNLVLDFGPLPEDHTSKHERGANEPVSAG
ncbi:unnamed protein product [Rhizoctonia solani]|uniref:Uncharacterized protein n=1 Tax=Rhizoctonia solani TaxID=456999 RepID=A0A8H3I002_9AGAM|nr:unnamed protein product [Rhizoctonia solani]